MEIKRAIYLDKLIRKKKNGLIKVITGVRRCGKSYLLFLVSLDCAMHEHGTENHPLCGWKINGYTNKKITIRFI